MRVGELASKIIATNDTNELFKIYLISAALLCFLFPDGLVLSEYFMVDAWRFPYPRLDITVPGALPFYREYLFVMWMAMPLWVAWFGFVYSKNYSSKHIKFWPLIAAWIFFSSILFLIFYLKSDFHEGHGSRDRLLIAAARCRIVGTFVYPGMMGFVYLMACAVFAKCPIDLYRIIKK